MSSVTQLVAGVSSGKKMVLSNEVAIAIPLVFILCLLSFLLFPRAKDVPEEDCLAQKDRGA